MNAIDPRAAQAFAPEAIQWRLITATLASFRAELDADPFDHSPLTERLRIWHGGFTATLNRYDHMGPMSRQEYLERTITAYTQMLLHDIQVPQGQYRMLQPIVDFLHRNHIPIPEQFVQPSPEQIRAARVEAFRARQERHRPVVAEPEIVADPVLAGRVVELEQEFQGLDQRMVAVNARVGAEAQVLRQGIMQLEIPQLRQEVARLETNQRATGQDLTRVERVVDQLERDVAETKKALTENPPDNPWKDVFVVIVTVAALIAINHVVPGGGAQLFSKGRGLGIEGRIFL